MSNTMELYEANTHVFVVKIWLEEGTENGGQARWRGHITHLLDGERRYIQDLDEIIDFISLYLERMGVKRKLHMRLRDYLKLKKGSK